MDKIKIAIDAHGGDNAPLEQIKGGYDAARQLDVTVVLVGNQEILSGIISENGLSHPNLEIADAREVITNDDDVMSAIKTKKDSSMVVGLNMIKAGRADAFISAGSTGALMTGATLIVKRIPGVRRAALAPIFITDRDPAMLIDAGANTSCKPEYFLDFAIMASVYMERVEGITNPRVGLVNIGTELSKGGDNIRSAYDILSAAANINFIGNIEARDIPAGVCDVVVCDGFTGNIILKLMEGMGIVFYKNLKEIVKENVFSMLGAALMKKGLMRFKKKIDYHEFGGAPLLGIDGVVIKAHGSSNARSVFIAAEQAKRFVQNRANDEIKREMEVN